MLRVARGRFISRRLTETARWHGASSSRWRDGFKPIEPSFRVFSSITPRLKGPDPPIVLAGSVTRIGWWEWLKSLPRSLASWLKRTISAILTKLRIMLRMGHLSLIFTPAAFLGALSVIPGPHQPRMKERFHRLLKWTLETAGCTFIKLGQWMSHREDMFPTELCVLLRDLRSDSPAHKLSHTKTTMIRSFGRSIEDVFSEFDPTPTASGSIAQVHRAVLKDNVGGSLAGKQVAVKVRHPRVEKLLYMDLELLRTAVAFIAWMPGMESLRVPVALDEFSEVLRRQVDLSLEAEHLEKFNKNFEKSTLKVAFPQPVESLVSPEVLVESWEEGITLQAFIDANSPLNPGLAELGYEVFMTMLLVHNFMHADCHAGNIMVRGRPVDSYPPLRRPLTWWQSFKRWAGLFRKQELPDDSEPTLVVLDAGLVTQMSATGRKNLHRLLYDVFTGDGANAAKMFLSLSSTKCKEPEQFTTAMKQLFLKRVGAPRTKAEIAHDVMSTAVDALPLPSSLRNAFQTVLHAAEKDESNGDGVFKVRVRGRVNVGELISDIMSLVRKYGMKLETDFVSVILSVGILEGLARSLDPEIDLVARLGPYMQKEASSLIGEAVTQVREVVKETRHARNVPLQSAEEDFLFGCMAGDDFGHGFSLEG